MRTTLTLDDDVAAQLDRLRRQRSLKFRDLVNDALRRGLRDMSGEPRTREVLRTRAFDMGEPLINIDNVAEALGHLESEGFK
jgi:adenine C2-methylase RlmN of 23S rRNA A2503 and tRNA A37